MRVVGGLIKRLSTTAPPTLLKHGPISDPFKQEYTDDEGFKRFRCGYCKRDGFKRFSSHLCGRAKANQLGSDVSSGSRGMDTVAEVSAEIEQVLIVLIYNILICDFIRHLSALPNQELGPPEAKALPSKLLKMVRWRMPVVVSCMSVGEYKISFKEACD